MVGGLNGLGEGVLRLQWESMGGSDRAHLHSSLGGPDAKPVSSLSENSQGEGLWQLNSRKSLLFSSKGSLEKDFFPCTHCLFRCSQVKVVFMSF